jgi:hypothetical protein
VFVRIKFLLACLILVSLIYALPVEQSTAKAVANSRLVHDGRQEDHSIASITIIKDDETASALAYVFELDPTGYVIVGADDQLPPVIAYSYTNLCRDDRHGRNILFDLVKRDVLARLANAGRIPEGIKVKYEKQWHEYITGDFVTLAPALFEQWPPAGSTPTGGWLMENWSQGSPYYNYCPMDLNAGQRSVAGCPAVAMAAILNFQEEINGTRFDDGDDYYHNFYEQYWIDDDHVAHDFPSWPELDVYLDTLENHYGQSIPTTSSDKAALVFACGVACHQVYSASVSGTYSITQAATAYQRFDFVASELLYDSSANLFERLSHNMMVAMPAHMGIVDSGWNYGHNIVVDGYNTDSFYHFNFGWSGSWNGWYQFPLTGMPYGMNIIEGIILDIGDSSHYWVEEADNLPSGGMFLTLACSGNPVRSNPSVCITLQQASHVNLAIYSITGRLVGTLADREFSHGSHRLIWKTDGLASGVYIVSAWSPQGRISEKIIVLK